MANITKGDFAIAKDKRDKALADLEKARQDLEDARKEGDLRENKDYDDAKVRVRRFSKEYERLADIVQSATVVDGTNPKYVFTLDGTEMTKVFDTIGVHDYDDSISDKSPLGSKLKDAQVGDEFDFEDIIGNSHHVQVLLII